MLSDGCVASSCIILAQEMRGADDEAAGPGHASGTLLCAGLQGGSQYVVGYIGSPSAIRAADEGSQWSMSLPSRRSLAEARIALGSFDRFLLLYGTMFAAFGAASPFLPALLHERGLGPSEIGAVLAAGTAVRLITAPVISRLADRLGKHRRTLAVSIAIAAVIAFA
jgi:predicted MFS family arabinose efflux permease